MTEQPSLRLRFVRAYQHAVFSCLSLFSSVFPEPFSVARCGGVLDTTCRTKSRYRVT